MGHKATIADDYQNLKEIVLEKRRDEVLDKWIREKQKHTYVRIKDNWKNNCTFKYPGWIKELSGRIYIDLYAKEEYKKSFPELA